MSINVVTTVEIINENELSPDQPGKTLTFTYDQTQAEHPVIFTTNGVYTEAPQDALEYAMKIMRLAKQFDCEQEKKEKHTQ